MTSTSETLRLPATVVQRIVKDALPDNAMVSKEARTAIARAAAVFILNMATHASDYATSRKRKAVTAEDVYQAVKVIECDKMEKPLKEAVELWKIVKSQKAEEAKRKKTERSAAAANSLLDAPEAEEAEEELEQVEEEAEGQQEGEEAPESLDESMEDEVSQELNEPEVRDIEDMM